MVRERAIIVVPVMLSILCGISYFAYNNQWIIFRSPLALRSEKHHIERIVAQKKNIKHFFWHHHAWRQESVDILWSEDKVHALNSLITSWLTIVEEERISVKKVSLQALTLCASKQEILCSFDRNPFNKQQSTFDKLMWIEGLLRSISETGLKLQTIRFLVHHQPMHDVHLDFSNAWPLEGFLKN